MQETRWPDTTHDNFFFLAHNISGDNLIVGGAAKIVKNGVEPPSFDRISRLFATGRNIAPGLGHKDYIWLMEVTDALISNLAKLSRLHFDEKETEMIRKDLQQMIGFVDKLQELDTTGVEPLLHMSNRINVLRDDEVQGSVSREQALKNAPDSDGVFFKVPKVIKKQEENR